VRLVGRVVGVVLASIGIGAGLALAAGLVLAIVGLSAPVAWLFRRYKGPWRSRLVAEWIWCAYFGLIVGWIGVGAFQAVTTQNRSLGIFAMGEGVAWFLVTAWFLRRHPPA
jgi:hypothetical protein